MNLLILQRMVFFYNGCQLAINSVVFICDAPARAMLQGIVSFSGYFGCAYCRQRGEYYKDRIIFPSITDELRTDEAYKVMSENNQVSELALVKIVP